MQPYKMSTILISIRVYAPKHAQLNLIVIVINLSKHCKAVRLLKRKKIKPSSKTN